MKSLALLHFFCVLFTISFTPVIYAQSSEASAALEQRLRSMASTRLSALQVKNQQLNPMTSPYFFEDWQEGKGIFVQEPQDTFSATVLMNIDLLRQMLAVQFRDGAIGYISPMHVRHLSIREKLYFQHDFVVLPEYLVEGGNNQAFAFYERIYDGEFTLLKRVYKRSQSQYALGLSSVTGNRNADVITTETYWFSEDQQSYKKMLLRRKSIEKLMPEMKDEIRDLVKKHQLNLFEEKDVLQLLEFLETS